MASIARALGVSVLTALLLASTAAAGDKPATPPPNAAVAQYTEQIPTGVGSVPVGQSPRAQGRALPKKVSHELAQQGTAGKELQQVSTDPGFGAPAATQPAAKPRTAKPAPKQKQQKPTARVVRRPLALPVTTPSAASAATRAAGQTVPFSLILVLALVLVGGGAAAVVRRRR